MTVANPPRATYRWRLVALSLTMLLPSLGTSIANVALPSLRLSFDADFAQVQWVVISYLLAVTTLIVGAGRLGDIFGRRRMLLAGIALFTIASLACAISPSLVGRARRCGRFPFVDLHATALANVLRSARPNNASSI